MQIIIFSIKYIINIQDAPQTASSSYVLSFVDVKDNWNHFFFFFCLFDIISTILMSIITLTSRSPPPPFFFLLISYTSTQQIY